MLQQSLVTLLLAGCLLITTNGQKTCTGNADVVFAIDASGSIKDQDPGNWDRLKNFVIEIASNMARSQRTLRMGLVTFSDNATSNSYLRDFRDVSTFSNNVRGLTFVGGYTNHAAALRVANNMFTGNQNDRYIIIVTDGMPTVEQGAESTIARNIRGNGVTILAIGVTSNINTEKLLDLTGDQDYVFQAQDFKDSLSKQVMNIIEAAGGCLGPASDIGNCNGPPEVVLALDTSGSINDADPNNFKRLLDFAISIARDIAQRRSSARFALVSFSTKAKVETRLSQFSDVNAFATLVSSTPFVGEYTNHADAIRTGRGLLTAEARTPSAKYIIVVTDGTPTQEIGDEIAEAEVTRSQGIKIILVGVTSMIDEQNLIKMAGDVNNVFKSPDFRSLQGQISNVVMATDSCPTERPLPGGEVCEATNVIFAVDASGSILEKGANNWDLMKTFVADLARSLSSSPNAKFGLVRFSSQAEILQYFSDFSSINNFLSAVLNMPYDGGFTNMADAFRKAREIIVRESTSYPQVILITDGIPTREQGQELKEAQTLKDIGARILTIGVTSDINEKLLASITGNSRQNFQSPTFQTLSSQVIPVVSTACRAPAPSPGSPATGACNANPDIVFAVDASGSITEQDRGNWQRVIELLEKSVQSFFTRFPTVRFGLVLFSTNAKVAFTLTDFSQINQVYDAIRNLEYIGSRTNIADGIAFARDQVFARASRPNVQRIMIIITDGVSNERVGQEVAEAERAKALGIRTVTVGVTDAVSFDILRQIASDPSTGVIGTPNFQTLTNVIEPVINAACLSRDLPRCTKVDIALLVDSSGSIMETGDNWPLVIATLNRIVEVLDEKTDFGPDGAQVSIVLFSTNAKVILPLTGNKQVLLDAIRNLPFLQSRTNLAEAMFMTRFNIFNGNDRSDAVNVALVISDGKPNEPRDEAQGVIAARDEAMQLHSVTSSVAAIGVTRFIDEELLRDRIATSPRLFLKARDFQELETSASKIVDRICN